MKYTGRITALSLVLIISLIDIVYYFIYENLHLLDVFDVLIYLPLSWFFGKKYDESNYLSKHLKELFDNVDAMIWENDPINQILTVSKGIELITGYSVKDFKENYFHWLDITHPDDQKQAYKLLQDLVSGKKSSLAFRIITRDHQTKWITVKGTPIFNEKGEVVNINGICVDITKEKESELKLKESEYQYRTVVETSPNMIIIFQYNKILYANKAAFEVIGITNKSDLINKSPFDFIHPKDHEKLMKRNIEIYEGRAGNKFHEYRLVKANGEVINIEALGLKITYMGKPSVMTVLRDITLQKMQQDKIKQLAYYDILTGLPNRSLLSDSISKAIRICKQENKKLAVMFLDLDRFKSINDTRGHALGDALLKKVAKRLLESVRKGDIIARHGGDEFIILLEDIDETQIKEIAQRILDSFMEPFYLNEEEFYTSTSIGISLYPQDGDDFEKLIKNADTAMYLAKKRGKNNFQFFIYEHEDLLGRKTKLEQGFRRALKNSEFVLHYQPQVDLNTRECIGIEALIRWKHPEFGIVPPFEFIPIAEETGIIVQIGEWVIGEVCRQMKAWHDKGLPPLKVAVNVSPLQIQDKNFVKVVK